MRKGRDHQLHTIWTIGYEGATPQEFVATLRRAGVEVLIDVRDCPVSRKPGFSKHVLAGLLGEAGIAYVHLRQLGDPKAGREAARRGDVRSFQRIFRAHLMGSDAQEALEEALDISARARCCLLCFERDPAGCHRTIVAEEMACRKDIEIRHLGVQRQRVGESSYSRP